MAVESDTERALMLGDFGVTVTYGAGSSFVGIFDSGFELVSLGEVGVASAQLRLLARSSDVDGIARGTTLTISAVTYTLQEHQPDGTGMTTLLLTRA